MGKRQKMGYIKGTSGERRGSNIKLIGPETFMLLNFLLYKKPILIIINIILIQSALYSFFCYIRNLSSFIIYHSISTSPSDSSIPILSFIKPPKHLNSVS